MKSIKTKLLLLLKICSLVEISKAQCGAPFGCGDCPGYYWDTFTCKPCPRGTYITGTVGKPCEPCAAGTYAPKEASLSCTPCPAGEYQPNIGQSFCLKCNPGEFQNLLGQSMCKPCVAGSYQALHGQSKCKLCGVGQYQPDKGQDSCIQCKTGEFQNRLGQSDCKPCDSGSYQDKEGGEYCKLCPRGEYQSEEGKTKCIKCNPGEFQYEVGKSKCILCPEGQYQDKVGQATCKQCWRGSYQNTAGNNTCKLCPAGTFSEQIRAVSLEYCKLCPRGEYQSEEGKTKCIKCNPGEFQNQTGQTKCLPCVAGKFSDSIGTINCSSCPKGMYQPKIGQSFCSNCGSGKYQDSEGGIECKNCPSGTYSFEVGNTDVSRCLKCGKGTFQNNTGQSSCDRCDEGRYQTEEGATSCKSCGVGNYTRVKGSIECEQCLPGTYQDASNSTSCKLCEDGTYSPNLSSSKCDNCKSGGYCTIDTYVANGGFIACPAGTYNENLKSSSNEACSECPIGTFSLEVGANSSSACKKCPPGQYQNETGKQVCIPCEIGSYQDEFEQDHCKECNIGEHTNVTGSFQCNECPYPLTNFDKGSHNCSVCRDGYYVINGTIDIHCLHSKPREFCKECPLNATGTKCKAGTTLTDIPLMTGYWRASKFTSQIYKCNFENNCKGSSLSFDRQLISDGKESDEYCTENYTGALCEACLLSNEYFDNVDGKCKNCRISTLFVHLGISSVAVLFFGSIIWAIKNRLTPLTITASSLSIQAKVKILIGFYQIMSAFTDVYGVAIHSDLKQIFYFVPYIFSFEFLSSFPLDCLGRTTVAYVISGIWPYLMCIFFWICLKIFKHARLCSKSCHNLRIMKGMPNLDFSQVIVIIFYFALPIVSKHTFAAKICEAFQVDDAENAKFKSFLVSSRTIEFDMEDSDFRELQFCFWIFFLLWPCFTLLGFTALVAKVFTSVHLERPSALAIKCQFLWRDFDPTSNIAVYWDIIDFTRKVFLIGFINFVDQNEGSNKLLRLTIATSVSSAFMLILLYVRPYRRSDDFQLAVVSSFLITLAFGLGYILQICEDEEGACEKYIATGIDDHLGASILVTILMIAMLIIAFLALIVQTRLSPILRSKSTRHPPNLDLPEDCTHHVFTSHSFGYFERPNCRREFYRALFLDKPVILVYSDDSFPLKVVEAYKSEKNSRDENIYFELIKKECTKFCLSQEEEEEEAEQKSNKGFQNGKFCLLHDEGEERKSSIDFQKEIIQMLEKSQVPECDFVNKVVEMRHKVELFISKIDLKDSTPEQGETEDNTNTGDDSILEQGNGYFSLSQEENNDNDDSFALAIQWLKTGSFSSESLKLIYLRI